MVKVLSQMLLLVEHLGLSLQVLEVLPQALLRNSLLKEERNLLLKLVAKLLVALFLAMSAQSLKKLSKVKKLKGKTFLYQV
jgi:hypothetical protein